MFKRGLWISLGVVWLLFGVANHASASSATVKVVGGQSHSLVLTASGDVYSFGYGARGQLGHGDTSDQLVPKKIVGVTDIVDISASDHYSLALTRSGDVYSFGRGDNGRLGHGDTSDQLVPKKIDGVSDIVDISAGSSHALLLTRNGEVYSFGSSSGGRHGHGDTSDQLVPKKMQGISGVAGISAGSAHSLLLTDSGEVYSFGVGFSGQLGHGDGSEQLVPKKIQGISDVASISVGGTHSLLITRSGEVYSFGSGFSGQLGHGDTSNQLVPKKIQGVSDVADISAGDSHSFLLMRSGEVYSFGYGASGRLGHGDTNNQLVPKRVTTLVVAPAEVSGLTETHDHEKAKLSWTKPLDIDFAHVIIERNGTQIATNVKGTTYEDKGLKEGTTYTYVVKAVDTSGHVSSGKSLVLTTMKKPDTVAPMNVSNVKQTVDVNTVKFTWKNPTDHDFSHIMITRNGVEIARNVKGAMYEDKKLKENTTYTYLIVSVDKTGNRSKGQTVVVTTKTNTVYHTVKKNDTLYSLAKRHGVTVNQLKTLNGLKGNVIYVGQKLIVKKGSYPLPNYTIKRGDTLYSISKRYNVTVAQLKAWNGLKSNIIYVGQRLKVSK